MGRDPFHQPRLLKAPSNLALNPAREGEATASLGNLGQGLTTLRVKNFFLMSSLNLRSFSLKPCPLAVKVKSHISSYQLLLQCLSVLVWRMFLFYSVTSYLALTRRNHTSVQNRHENNSGNSQFPTGPLVENVKAFFSLNSLSSQTYLHAVI